MWAAPIDNYEQIRTPLSKPEFNGSRPVTNPHHGHADLGIVPPHRLRPRLPPKLGLLFSMCPVLLVPVRIELSNDVTGRAGYARLVPHDRSTLDAGCAK